MLLNRYLLIAGIIFIFNVHAISQGQTCATAAQIYLDSSYTYPMQINNTNTDTSFDYGCLCTVPNPLWCYFQSNDTGFVNIHISSDCGDIDYAAWGPFNSITCSPADMTCNNGSNSCVCGGNYNSVNGNMVDCAYSTADEEDLYIPNLQPGDWYIVVITNYANCTGNVNFEVTSSSTYKEQAETPKENFEIFPNPGKGIFNIQSDKKFLGDVYLTVRDMNGRTILEEIMRKPIMEIDLQNFKDGIYIVEIKTRDYCFKKLIIKH